MAKQSDVELFESVKNAVHAISNLSKDAHGAMDQILAIFPHIFFLTNSNNPNTAILHDDNDPVAKLFNQFRNLYNECNCKKAALNRDIVHSLNAEETIEIINNYQEWFNLKKTTSVEIFEAFKKKKAELTSPKCDKDEIKDITLEVIMKEYTTKVSGLVMKGVTDTVDKRLSTKLLEIALEQPNYLYYKQFATLIQLNLSKISGIPGMDNAFKELKKFISDHDKQLGESANAVLSSIERGECRDAKILIDTLINENEKIFIPLLKYYIGKVVSGFNHIPAKEIFGLKELSSLDSSKQKIESTEKLPVTSSPLEDNAVDNHEKSDMLPSSEVGLMGT